MRGAAGFSSIRNLISGAGLDIFILCVIKDFISQTEEKVEKHFFLTFED